MTDGKQNVIELLTDLYRRRKNFTTIEDAYNLLKHASNGHIIVEDEKNLAERLVEIYRDMMKVA